MISARLYFNYSIGKGCDTRCNDTSEGHSRTHIPRFHGQAAERHFFPGGWTVEGMDVTSPSGSGDDPGFISCDKGYPAIRGRV